MSYETTDYRYPQDPAARTARGAIPGDRRQPIDMQTGGGSARGLLIAVVVIAGFIALIALFSAGGDPATAPAGLQTAPPTASQSDGTAGGAEITPAPAAPAQGE